MVALAFELLDLADVPQNKDRSRARLALLEPCMPYSNPEPIILTRNKRLRRSLTLRDRAPIRFLQIARRQLYLFSCLPRPLKRLREQQRKLRRHFELPSQHPHRFWIENTDSSSNLRRFRFRLSRFDHQHATGQAFKDAAQSLANAAVLRQTRRQITVRNFELPPKLRNQI